MEGCSAFTHESSAEWNSVLLKVTEEPIARVHTARGFVADAEIQTIFVNAKQAKCCTVETRIRLKTKRGFVFIFYLFFFTFSYASENQ